MSTENTVDKVKLISELKEIHSELFHIYKTLFDFKYKHNEVFKSFIDREYKENGVGSKEKKAWNDNFCHRASYTLLNKILFVRICEDKGFMRNAEDYIAGEVKDTHIGEKLSKVGLQKWGRLITNYSLGELIKFAFNDMKRSYSNIVLYKEDKYEILNPRDEEFSLRYIDGDEDVRALVLEFENILNNIIEKLDTNNFNFKYTDGNILGDVYEKFMDRETRKAIGQFYTPEFVIEYILKNTVEEADVVENPFVTVADISCGSGHFLIMAYDILREKFLNNLKTLKEKYTGEIYTIKKDGKETQVAGSEYWTTEHIHYHILKHCIYGADIDSFAVQLTTINLLLKDLDNFTDELNIIECDSLTKWEVDYNWMDLNNQMEVEFETVITTQTNLFNEEERFEQTVRRENYKLKFKDIYGKTIEQVVNRERAEEILSICKFWNNKFSYVVGNPPYVGQKGNKELFNKFKVHPYWKKYYERKQDIYYYFMIRGLDNLREGGKLGFINPPYWLTASASIKLKEYLIHNCELLKVYDFGDYKMFDDAQINGNIFIFIKNTTSIHDSKIAICKFDKNELSFSLDYSRYRNLDLGLESWSVFDLEGYENYFERCSYIKLQEISSIPQGLISGCDKVTQSHIEKYNLENFVVGEGIFVLNKEEIKKFNEIEMEYVKPFYKNSDVDRYYSNTETNQFILITNEIDDIDKLPNIKEHLMKYKVIIDGRARNFTLKKAYKEGKWFALTTYRPNIKFEGKKLITPYRNKISKFAYSDTPYYGSADIFYMQLNSQNYNIFYILGIINSNLILYWLYNNCKKKGDNLELYAEPLGNIPIRDCGNENQLEIMNIVKKIINLRKLYYSQDNMEEILKSKEIVSKYIEIQQQLKEIEREITNLEKNLNLSVYRLYGINDDEVINIEKFLVENISNFKELTVRDTEITFAKLFNYINSLMVSQIEHLINELKCYCSVDKIKEMIEENVLRINDIKEVMRKDDITINMLEMIGKWINSDIDNWSSYRKAKLQNKIIKTFVRYPDNTYYGLSEWSDEIHKQYFMDAIDEYTSNNPNEKKAKDILKLFKELEIEDKEDYVDIIEDKIKKAFS